MISDLLTTNQAAKIVGVDSATIRSWIRTGKLPGFKLVGRVRVSKADVEALVKPIGDAPRMESPEAKMVRDAETRATLALHGIKI